MQVETDLRAARLMWIANKQDSVSLSPTLLYIEHAVWRVSLYRGHAVQRWIVDYSR